MTAPLSNSLNPSRSLSQQDIRTLAIAALGGALEFYDFIIFVFFAPVMGLLFFPPDLPQWLRQVQTYGIFSAGYLARPLGGIVLAHFGDLLGRKRMFGLSITLMALPTLMIGCLPTYASIGLAAPLILLLLRLLQGAAIGGEVPGAWVFVAEHVPEGHTGYACGTLTAGLTFGILLGSLMASFINSAFEPRDVQAWAWRLPYLIGGVFGVVAIYLRRWLHETPVFAAMQTRKALAAELPLKTVLSQHKKAVALSMLLTWMLTAGVVVVILMTPPYLQEGFGITPVSALRANAFATLGLTIGCILSGRFADRFGAARSLMVGSFFFGVASSVFFYSLPLTGSKLLALYALAGLSVGIVGAIPSVLVGAFPAAVRFSGLSFSYNVSYAIFGGLTPVVLALLLKVDPLAPAHYVMAMAGLGVTVGVYLWLAEGRKDTSQL